MWALLAARWPEPECALVHENPFELLVATILSAQCTDARVNQVTPALFARYPDARALANADPADVERLVKSTGFFRNKTKSLIGAAKAIVASFRGEVPRTMDALLTLPGVARKTANVVLGTGYGVAAGVVVDTHVKRLAYRMGFTRETAPEKVERDLQALFPEATWIRLSHTLIHHGRGICGARKPDCARCPVANECPSAAATPAD
jgi:endonuclease-3